VLQIAHGELGKPRDLGFVEQEEMPAAGFRAVRIDRIERPLLARTRPARKIAGTLVVARLAERGMPLLKVSSKSGAGMSEWSQFLAASQDALGRELATGDLPRRFR
jgi:hypothetical protein